MTRNAIGTNIPIEIVYGGTGATTAAAALANLGALPLAGGTMTGPLILSGNPTVALQAATKQYADAISGGLTVKTACFAASTANLTAAYANGAAGVGATLTNSGAQVAFAIDGVSPALNARILIKDQTSTFENGVYTLSTIGSGATNWVLTRATDYDQPAEIQPGNLILISSGTLNGATSWIETATVTTIGTDPIVFSQFTASPNTFANTALSNLAAVAINTTLSPSADTAQDIGAVTARWGNIYTTSVRAGNVAANTLAIAAWDTLGATWNNFFILTSGNPPTAVLGNGVSATTQAPNDNTTKVATTAYSDAIAALKANVTLNNLTTTAINVALLSATDSTLDLGNFTNRWNNLYTNTIRTGQSIGHSIQLEAYDTTGISYTTFATLTAGPTPTMSLSGAVTSVTQSALNNSTLIATTAYVDNATGGAIPANRALSNLLSVAINASLIAGADGAIDLGSGVLRWRNIYAQQLNSGTVAGNTLLLQAFNTVGLSYTTFATLTSGVTPTMSLASSVTSTTQAPSDNSTKIATTAYVDAAVTGGTGANTALSNLAAVAINQSLIAGADGTLDLGSAALRWNNLFAENIKTGTTNAQSLIISGYNTVGATYTPFLTITTNATATAVLGSAVTGTTQAALDASTKLATTAYVDSAVTTGTGANKALSNLAAVALNLSLLPGVDNSIDLGSATIRWANTYPSTVRTGTGAGNTTLLQAYNIGGSSYTTFATLTANATPTMSLASAVTGTTQSAGDNSTKLSTTAYTDRMVPLAGGTMSGALILNADPVAALGAVTKQYADAIAAGISFKAACYAASTAALTVTYVNGAAGIGATLTNAGAQAAFSVDGVSPPVTSRILIKNQASAFQNGIYTLTVVGTGATNWVLTRSTDYDQAPSEIFPGTLVNIDNGTLNINTSWVETATVTTIGTDAINFSQFTSAPLALPVSVTNGGTGVSTLTTAYGTLVAGTTATGPVQTVAPGTTGQALISAGNASIPAYGTLGVAGGGTGLTTFTTAYGTVVAGTTATGPLQTVSPGTTGQALVSAGNAAPPAYGTLGVTGGGTGVTTLTTAYGVLTAGTTATGPVQTLAALGASGTVLTSNGAGALPSFQAVAGGVSALTLLATSTTSGAATIDFANNLSATYDSYWIVVEDLLPATNAVNFNMRVGTGAGPTYQTTGYVDSVGSTTFMMVSVTANRTAVSLVNTASRVTGWSIWLSGANSANDKSMYATGSSSAGSLQANIAYGQYQSSTVLTSLRFLMSSGNIAATIKLYGLKN